MKRAARPGPADAALDALAAALAPRVAELVLERLRNSRPANEEDNAIAELVRDCGFEIEHTAKCP